MPGHLVFLVNRDTQKSGFLCPGLRKTRVVQSIFARVAIFRFFPCCGQLGNIERFSNECRNAKTKEITNQSQQGTILKRLIGHLFKSSVCVARIVFR